MRRKSFVCVNTVQHTVQLRCLRGFVAAFWKGGGFPYETVGGSHGDGLCFVSALKGLRQRVRASQGESGRREGALFGRVLANPSDSG